MKIKNIALFLLFCLCLTTYGCGGSPATDSEGESKALTTNTVENEDQSSDKIKSITEFSDAWSNLYSQNEKAINNANPELGITLATPGLEFVTGVQYDLLNLENKNGRFEGELMLAGYPGYMEKSGSVIKFGYDYIREEDGFGQSMKAGDHMIEEGSIDLKKEIYQTERYTERDGQKISRSYSEFIRTKDGEMICLATTCDTISMSGEANISNTTIYMKLGKNKVDFVTGKSTEGVGFEPLKLIGKSDLSKEDARSMMEAAGYQIEQSGGIKGGSVVLD